MSLQPPLTAKQFLREAGVRVNVVQRRLQHHPEGLQLQLPQVQAVHRFLLHQQHLRHISSAVAVLEALPETLLFPVEPQLKALFAALRCAGFTQQQHLTSLLTNCGRGAALDLLLVPAAEIAPRLAHLGQLLRVPEERLPAYVSAQPQLLLVPEAEAAATVRWLGSALGWSPAALRRNLAAHADILRRSPAQLDGMATLLQHRLDLPGEELVLLLHVAPQLLALSCSELELLVETRPSSVQLVRATAAPVPEWNVYAAQSMHLKLGMLKLSSMHGLTLEEIGAVARDKPTILRELKP